MVRQIVDFVRTGMSVLTIAGVSRNVHFHPWGYRQVPLLNRIISGERNKQDYKKG